MSIGINLLFGCAQIELTVRSIEQSSGFLEEVLGAGKIEQRLAREISKLFSAGEHRMEHLACGDAVFQLNQPSTEAGAFRGQPPIHLRYLEKMGPCVTNLNYYVDDAVHAHELLTELGAQTHIRGPSDIAACLADYGDNNSPSVPGEFFFMGSCELIGLDLEFMERSSQEFPG